MESLRLPGRACHGAEVDVVASWMVQPHPHPVAARRHAGASRDRACPEAARGQLSAVRGARAVHLDRPATGSGGGMFTGAAAQGPRSRVARRAPGRNQAGAQARSRAARRRCAASVLAGGDQAVLAADPRRASTRTWLPGDPTGPGRYRGAADRPASRAGTRRARDRSPEQRRRHRTPAAWCRTSGCGVRVRLAARDGRHRCRQPTEQNLRTARYRRAVAADPAARADRGRARGFAWTHPSCDPACRCPAQVHLGPRRRTGPEHAAIGAPLAVLRRAGLVSSWRAGRRVLYQLTPLARSVLAASISASATPAEPA